MNAIAIKCGNCNGTHESVAGVRACYEGDSATVKQYGEPEPTDRMRNYAQMLFRERLAEPGTIVAKIEAEQGREAAENAINAMGRHTMGNFIDSMKRQPYRPRESRQVETRPGVQDPEDGIYYSEHTNEFRKVYKGQSGRMLCKRLVVTSEAIWDKDENDMPVLMAAADKHWEYLGLATRFLDGYTKVDKETAARFGKIYGFCMICSRTLTDEVSIARGIGPVCEGRAGW